MPKKRGGSKNLWCTLYVVTDIAIPIHPDTSRQLPLLPVQPPPKAPEPPGTALETLSIRELRALIAEAGLSSEGLYLQEEVFERALEGAPRFDQQTIDCF